jgi:hypothetical protein
MKSQPETMPPFGHAEESALSRFGQQSFSVWRLSGKPLTLGEIIENRRQYLNSIDLQALAAFTGRIRGKQEGVDPGAYRGLRKAVDCSRLGVARRTWSQKLAWPTTL